MQTAEAIQANQITRKSEIDAIRKAVPGAGIVPAKKRYLPVLTPTLGAVSMWWHSKCSDMIWPMNTGKAFIPMIDLIGGQIAEMRNRLVTIALDYKKTHDADMEYVMWLDDDVICSHMAMCRLLSHNRDIASGVYFCKGETGNEPLIFAGPSSGTMKFIPDEVFEAWGWAQGLCVIRTEVYERMRDELDLGVDRYGNPNWYKVPDFGVDANGCITTGGTEDFHFFGNAAKLGYRPLIDCTKFAFGFHYDLGTKLGYPVQQWEQWVKMQHIVWPEQYGGKETVWQ